MANINDHACKICGDYAHVKVKELVFVDGDECFSAEWFSCVDHCDQLIERREREAQLRELQHRGAVSPKIVPLRPV